MMSHATFVPTGDSLAAGAFTNTVFNVAVGASGRMRYKRVDSNTVMVVGSVTVGPTWAGSEIGFTFPEGYRPPSGTPAANQGRIPAVATGGEIGTIVIASTGVVTLSNVAVPAANITLEFNGWFHNV
jgi:hypothetical protein